MSLIAIAGRIGSGKDTVAKMIQYLTYNQSRIDKDYAPMTYEGYCKSFPNLVRESNTWEVRKFAGKLKEMVSLLTGIPTAELEKESVKSFQLGKGWDLWYYRRKDKDGQPEEMMPLGNSDPEAFFRRFGHIIEGEMYSKPMTVRHLLQTLGTQGMRDQVHPNIHVNALFADYIYARHQISTMEKSFPDWIISDLRFPNEYQAIKDRDGVCIRVESPTGMQDFTTVRHISETALDSQEFDVVIHNNGTMDELLQKVRTVLVELKIIKE